MILGLVELTLWPSNKHSMRVVNILPFHKLQSSLKPFNILHCGYTPVYNRQGGTIFE